jgi:hypothetical protein
MDGNDALILRQIKDDHGITTKQLADWCGYADPTMYRFCSGDTRIPSAVWRILYAKTQDPRIPKIVTGDEPVMLIRLDGDDYHADAATIQKLLETRRAEIEFEQQLLLILEDGVVNAKDRAAVVELKDRFPAMIQSLSRIYAGVMEQYKNSQKPAGRGQKK